MRKLLQDWGGGGGGNSILIKNGSQQKCLGKRLALNVITNLLIFWPNNLHFVEHTRLIKVLVYKISLINISCVT